MIKKEPLEQLELIRTWAQQHDLCVSESGDTIYKPDPNNPKKQIILQIIWCTSKVFIDDNNRLIVDDQYIGDDHRLYRLDGSLVRSFEDDYNFLSELGEKIKAQFNGIKVQVYKSRPDMKLRYKGREIYIQIMSDSDIYIDYEDKVTFDTLEPELTTRLQKL